jgi:hypothetical protein
MPGGGARRAFPLVPAAKNLVWLNRAADYDVEEKAPPTTTWRKKLCALCTPSICATGSVRSSPALPDEQRRAIRLRLFEARSGAEIAPLLGVTPQQVSQLWNSGFTTLRSALRAGPAVWWGTRKDQPTARHNRELRGSRAERR